MIRKSYFMIKYFFQELHTMLGQITHINLSHNIIKSLVNFKKLYSLQVSAFFKFQTIFLQIMYVLKISVFFEFYKYLKKSYFGRKMYKSKIFKTKYYFHFQKQYFRCYLPLYFQTFFFYIKIREVGSSNVFIC